jgi:hypothetical protein
MATQLSLSIKNIASAHPHKHATDQTSPNTDPNPSCVASCNLNTHFHVTQSQLASLDGAHIDEMQNLRTLLANSNALTSFPDGLAALPTLTRVNVAKNPDLVMTDEQVGALKQLCEVNKGSFIQ